MPTYSATSEARLSTCHPDLQVLFRVVVLEWDCTIIEGARDKAGQEAAFKSGASTLHWPEGKHCVDGVKRKSAWSVDVAPYPIDWDNRERFLYFGGYVMGVASELFKAGKMKHRLRFGGDWNGNRNTKDERLSDLPHFELLGVADGE